MADYYKNIDQCGCGPYGTFEGLGMANNDISGIRYDVVEDLECEPVSVQFFKDHARIDFNTDDNLIKHYIKSARQYLEGYSQLSFGVKTIELTAVNIPNNFHLMYGPVDNISTSGFDNQGDILKNGGRNVKIKYTTKDWCPDVVKIAICRYASGLYIFRENVNTELNGRDYIDEAKAMLSPFINITVF